MGGSEGTYIRAGSVSKVGIEGSFSGVTNLLDLNSLPIELDVTDGSGNRIMGVNVAGVTPYATGDLVVVGSPVDLTTPSRVVQGNLFLRCDGTPGLNAVGGSVVFSQIGSGRPLAAVAAIQTSADADQGGVGIYVHSSASGTDALTLAAVINHLGALVRYSGGVAITDTLGTGSPEGVVTANPASMYRDTTSGKLWVKETGTGNTGWVMK